MEGDRADRPVEVRDQAEPLPIEEWCEWLRRRQRFADGQVPALGERYGVRGSSASRRPSLMKVKLSISSEIATAGNMITDGLD